MKKKIIAISTILVAVLSMSSVFVQSAYAFGPRVFSVTRVAPWDKLNVREEPGASAKVIGKIPSDGEGVVVIGDKEKIGNAIWINVAWGSLKGWVNERYLASDYVKKEADTPQFRSRVGQSKETDKSDVALECGGVKPFWNIDISKNDIQVSIKDEHYSLPIYSQRTSSRYKASTIIKGKDRADTAKLYLTKDNTCRDGITSIDYPYTIRAIINGKTSYSGCCSLAEE